MRVASNPPRRAAGPQYLSVQPADPKPGSWADIQQILRGMSFDEIMCGVTFVGAMYVLLLLMVLFG